MLLRSKLLAFIAFSSLNGCNIFVFAADDTACAPVAWGDVSRKALSNIKYLAVPENAIDHAYEQRGYVSAPLDYDDPDGEQIKIFYRLLPAESQSTRRNDAPILVIMNGGPGVPSSAYRPINHDYETPSADDAFEFLSQYFQILLIDQRGVGYSAPLNLDDPNLSQSVIAKYFDSDEQARDHAKVIDAVVPRDQPLYILARSYGGHIGFQYLTLQDDVRQPDAIVFSSALLPHFDPLETFVLRRAKQRELNLELQTTHPDVIEKINRLRVHFERIGLDPNTVNYLWEYLGKGENWKDELSAKIEEYLAIENAGAARAMLGEGIQQSVNLLNYVLSSAALTPGYTDRTIAEETTKLVPYEEWMLDESWTLTQIGNDGTWREKFICAVDLRPPPPTQFASVSEIRNSISATRVLFTFGSSDAFLPQNLQLDRSKQYDVPGHTYYHVFAGGHGAAFSDEGAAVVYEWISR